MKSSSKVVRESAVIVLTGTAVNYPLSLLFLYLLIDVVEMESTFWIGTWVTILLTIVAFVRVLWIRAYYERRNSSE